MKTLLFSISFFLIFFYGHSAKHILYSAGVNANNLRYLISTAAPGDTIFLNSSLAGVELNSDELLIDKPISIFGVFHTQYIERSSSNGTPAFRVFKLVHCGDVFLKNIEVRGGISPTDSYSVPTHGGAILISDTNCHLHMENCVIRGNIASYGQFVNAGVNTHYPHGGSGGGICNYGKLTMVSCEISNNRAGNGGVVHYVDKDNTNGQFICCWGGDGGAIVNYYKAVLLNCSFFDNKAGNGGYFSSPFPNDECSGEGGDGGAIFNYSKLEIINSVFVHNSPGVSYKTSGGYQANHGIGGSIYNLRILYITNSTFAGHNYFDDYGIYGNEDDINAMQSNCVFCSGNFSLVLSNSILYNALGGVVPELQVSDSNAVSINYSLVRKINWIKLHGEKNLHNVDPMFVPTSNFRLSFNSPCINSGNPNTANLPDTDIDGQPRIVENVVDMGASEYQGFTGNNQEKEMEVIIFPNPSNGDFSVCNNNLNNSEIVVLSVIDMLGKTMLVQSYNQIDSPLKINLSGKVSSGIYFLNILTEKGNYRKKLIINQ